MPDIRATAEQERARRELARRRLIRFACYTFPQYTPAPAHELLALHLEAVERYIVTGGQEGIGRLMVFMPPRNGKSELVSVRFPAWFVGRNPNRHIILASCTADLASSFSRRVRNTVQGDDFGVLFGSRSGRPDPVAVTDDSRAADDWTTTAGGAVRAAGVGGAIVGRGAHLAIVDDPFKDRNDVESKLVRDRVDSWYKSTLYTRLEAGGAIVLMHQRWHSDDLAGRLLKRMVEDEGADQWTVLCLPAVAEDWAGGVSAERALQALRDGFWIGVDPLGRRPGEPLWGDKYPPAVLAQIRANVGGYEWDAMYQQRPRCLEGAMIPANKIPIVDQAPAGLRRVRYWDLAVSGSTRADYIASGQIGRGASRYTYIQDVTKMRGPWTVARPRMIEVMLADGPAVKQGIEVSGQQAGYYQELKEDPRLQGLTILPINPRDVGNKEVRANIWASRIVDGLIVMVRGPWNDPFISESLSFPHGEHDCQVDSISGAMQMMPISISFSAVPQAPAVASRWTGGQGVSWQPMRR